MDAAGVVMYRNIPLSDDSGAGTATHPEMDTLLGSGGRFSVPCLPSVP